MDGIEYIGDEFYKGSFDTHEKGMVMGYFQISLDTFTENGNTVTSSV